jgi:L,D-peptidoglycan transpeptidase YkuD (ErfK/YbiS/YcfS/YnhG family)
MDETSENPDPSLDPTPRSSFSRRSLLVAGGAGALTVAGARFGLAAMADPVPLPLTLAHLGSSRQVVVVTTKSKTYIHGHIQAWEKDSHGTWERVMAPHHCNIGSRGWIHGDIRTQGDRKTPAGTYRIHKSFGYAADPGTHIPYNHLDPGDYWAGDNKDPKTYNIFQTKHPKSAKWRKSQSEALYYTRPAYKYAACIDFNLATGIHTLKDGQRVATHPANTKIGSGIFLHCYGTTGADGYTLGCVSTRQDHVKWLLRWFKPASLPRIVMGPSSEITTL